MNKRIGLCIIFGFLILVFSQSSFAQNHLLEETLEILDNTIKEKEVYVSKKQKKIEALQEAVKHIKEEAALFQIYGELYNAHRTFNTDTAFYYANLQMVLAEKNENAEWKNAALFDLADAYNMTGMYHNALIMLDKIETSILKNSDKSRYFNSCAQVYELMSDYASRQEDKDKYAELKLAFRDSVLYYLEEKSGEYYYFVKADEIIAKGEELDLLAEKMTFISDTITNDYHSQALAEYFLAVLSDKANDVESLKLHLAKSAIADLKIAERDYISLRWLAEILYSEGSLDRAYNYLVCSLEDAALANLRLRTVEINKGFHWVNDAYKKRDAERTKQLIVALVLITLLAVVAIICFLFMRKWNRKLNQTKEKLSEANSALKTLHLNQKKLNVELKQTNAAKEVYIARYLTLCSEYIDKLEEQKTHLLKIGKTRNMDELLNAIKNSVQVDKEVKAFYHNFDVSFFSLFPNFIADFNKLLRENCRLQPKSNGDMTTELRVFALIRLGISDSEKIATFLRCSLSTVYNYRVKNRNAAIVDRNIFEEEILKIGL